MSKEKGKFNEQIINKLLKNRVLLRVFYYLFTLSLDFQKNQILFNSLFNEQDKQSMSRGQIISLIRQNNHNYSTYRSSRIVDRLINKKIIKDDEDPYDIETFSPQYLIIKGKIFAKAQPMSDYLREDIQSVISALKALKKIRVKTTIPMPVELVTNIRAKGSRRTNSWTLTEEGLSIGKRIFEIFEQQVEITQTDEKIVKNIGLLYEDTCIKLLEYRNAIVRPITKIKGIQKILQAKLDESSKIRGKSINEVLYDLSNSNNKNDAIIEDAEILLQTIKFIKFSMAVFVELNILLKNFSKQLQVVLESQKGIFDIKDFSKIVQNMFNNFENMKLKFNIPKINTFEQWNELSQADKDKSLIKKEQKSIEELVNLDFKNIVNSIEHIYELKYNIEKFLSENNSIS